MTPPRRALLWASLGLGLLLLPWIARAVWAGDVALAAPSAHAGVLCGGTITTFEATAMTCALSVPWPLALGLGSLVAAIALGVRSSFRHESRVVLVAIVLALAGAAAVTTYAVLRTLRGLDQRPVMMAWNLAQVAIVIAALTAMARALRESGPSPTDN